MLSRRPIAVRSPPRGFDDLVDWFDQFSANLVLLEEYDREDVRFAVEAIDRGVREHLRSFAAGDPATGAPRPASFAVLEADHARFLVSLEQLRWFYRIVEGEDHGGHRQALGQYGRVLTEALRRHRRDERAYLESRPRSSPVSREAPAEQR